MAIKLTNVHKSFLLEGQKMLVVHDVSLHVDDGEFVALVGPSGCGKSTILQLIAGFYPPDSGEITVEGKTGLMPQQDMLLPWCNIERNIALPCEIRGENFAEEVAKTENLLGEDVWQLFGLPGFQKSYPYQLSGGMRQRAALLRTYMDGGTLWLLDEPFAKLDALTKEELQIHLMTICRKLNRGILFVTHDINEAIALAGRIYVLSARPGQVIGEFLTDGRDHDELKREIKGLLRK